MMELLVFRHGIAAEATQGQPDALRPLTSRGVTNTTLAAQGLARLVSRPMAIMTSPLLRARQTAAILGELFDRAPQVDAVLSEGSAEDVVNWLNHRREVSLLIVGHEPTLSGVIERLCVGGNGATGFITMKKAACACLEMTPRGAGGAPHAVLQWLASPRLLRAAVEGR